MTGYGSEEVAYFMETDEESEQIVQNPTIKNKMLHTKQTKHDGLYILDDRK